VRSVGRYQWNSLPNRLCPELQQNIQFSVSAAIYLEETFTRHVAGTFRSALIYLPGYEAEDRGTGFEFRLEEEISLFSTAFRPALGPNQPPSKWILEVVSSGVKQPGRESGNLELYFHSSMV
jgi:hypothetical protein